MYINSLVMFYKQNIWVNNFTKIVRFLAFITDANVIESVSRRITYHELKVQVVKLWHYTKIHDIIYLSRNLIFLFNVRSIIYLTPFI